MCCNHFPLAWLECRPYIAVPYYDPLYCRYYTTYDTQKSMYKNHKNKHRYLCTIYLEYTRLLVYTSKQAKGIQAVPKEENYYDEKWMVESKY